MTPDEINRAIAAELGYKWKPKGDKYGPLVHPWIDPLGVRQPNIPDFYGDLNAMNLAEGCLGTKEQNQYAQDVRKALGFHTHTYFDMIHVQSPKRAEVWLRLKGKWKE